MFDGTLPTMSITHRPARILATLLTVISTAASGAGVPLSPAGDGHETVPVFVDGRGPYPFILDTGADSSAVYAWFAERANLRKDPGGQQELTGQTGTVKVTMYRLDDLELEGRHLRRMSAVGMANRHDAGREAGVLGNDFMDGALIVFDFPCHRVEVHGKTYGSKLAGDGPAPVQAGIDAGTTLLTLPVTVNGYTGIGVLDSGSRNTRLTPNFARSAGINAASSRFHDGATIYGATSKGMTPRDGPIGTVKFAGMENTHVTAQVIDLPALEDGFEGKPFMILGADLLGRYRLLYDHEDRKLWLRPSECRSRTDSAEASGDSR